MRLRHATLFVVAILAAACAQPAAVPAPSPTVTTPPAIAASPTPAPTGDSRSIAVTLSDQMRIEPATITVPRGQRVTFVVTNTGQIEHELYLGNEAAQAEHEEEMMSGAMAHGHSNAVSVAPGETEELTFTFTHGQWLAGCHVPGHYPAGMKAAIEVTD